MKIYVRASINTDSLKKEIKNRLLEVTYEYDPRIEVDISPRQNPDMSYEPDEYRIYIGIDNPDYEVSYFQLVEDTVNTFLKDKGFELVKPVHKYATSTVSGETYSGAFADRK